MGNHAKATGGLNFDFEYNINNPNEAEEDTKAYAAAFQSIIDNPLQTILRLPRKIIYSYYRGDSSITWALKSTEKTISPLMVSFIFYVTNMLFYFTAFLSLLFFIYGFRNNIKKPLDKLFQAVFIYFLVIVVLYFGNERFIISLFPIHCYYLVKSV